MKPLILLSSLCLSQKMDWWLLECGFLEKDDNKFVDIAIASNADYIITNDKHFKVLYNIPFPRVQSVTLQEFKIMIESQQII